MYCRSHFTRSLRDLRSSSIARTKTWSSLPPVQSFTSPNAMDDGTRLLGGTNHDFPQWRRSSTIHRGYYIHTLRWQSTSEAEERSLVVFALALGRFVTPDLGWNSMKCSFHKSWLPEICTEL